MTTTTTETADNVTHETGDRVDHGAGDRVDHDEPEATTEPETFPREYVEKLRQEAADARVKAKRTDELAQRLHGALVTATGRLADPSDLPYVEEHLDDEAALTAAIDDLLGRKPHLASRRPVGDIGQGATATSESVDLAQMLRARAG